MKGQLIVRFLPPVRGLISNVPPDKVGNDALIDGRNVFVDLDGRLKTRRGYSSVAGLLSPAERTIGLTSYEDQNGVFFPIVGTTKRWQALIAGAWTDISGGVLLNGDANDQVRFTPFASSGKNRIIGTNNVDVPKEWDSSLAAYTTLTNAPICRDVITLVNRVVAFNTVEGGIRFPYRTRWSEINDETTWPALNFADLTDTGDSIVGAVLTSRISAVIYRQYTTWYIQAVPGGDANAFAFDRIPAGERTIGPVGPGSIAVGEGNHYYFGIDGRVYQFNGTTVSPISDPIDAFTRGLYNTASPARFNSTYVPSFRQIVFFFALGASQDPNAAIVYDLRRQAFEPLWVFADNLTTSGVVREATGPNWTNWVALGVTWPTIPYTSWDSIPQGNQLSTYVGSSIGDVHRFEVAPTDNGVPIMYSATWGMQRSQDELSNSLVHFIELYQAQTMTAETVTATVLGLFQPLSVGSNSVQITSFLLNLSDQTTFYQTLTPGPNANQNIKSNLLQLIISSAGNQGQLNLDGATLLIDYDLRGDYALGAI